MTDVTAIGELLIDFAATGVDERGYPQMQANAGGAPCNFLAALGKYGRRTAFIGKVGSDTFGALLRGTLEKAGIDTRALITDARYFTTLAFVTFDEGGDRSFSFARKPGADTQLSFDEIDLRLSMRLPCCTSARSASRMSRHARQRSAQLNMPLSAASS